MIEQESKERLEFERGARQNKYRPIIEPDAKESLPCSK